jgi:hypothetical protein
LEPTYKNHENVINFVKDYLESVNKEDMDVSNKRKTLKARVKNLAIEYNFPKDFSNFISLFLLVTKFIYVEDNKWKVNNNLAEKINKEDFLYKNLFKFLFFTRDYNEYYKSPLVFNTPFVNNDFDVINKRRCIIKTIYSVCKNKEITFDELYKTLIKRYAFFRDYNDPQKFYYSKGEVFTNKQFMILFLFKTLNYLDVIEIVNKSSNTQDYKFRISNKGYSILNSFYDKENNFKTVIKPFKYKSNNEKENSYQYSISANINKSKDEQKSKYSMDFSELSKKDNISSKDFLKEMKQIIVRKVKEENVPNLLI